MKTKLEMAHEYLLRFSGTTVADAWQYADAMQAEADKREKEGVEEESKKRKEVRQKLINTFESNKLHCSDDWQPDWSQAPDGYDWWAMDGFSGVANWYKSEPFLDDDDTDEWNVVLSIATYREAPSFGYTGDWRNSLRKRPE